MIKELDKIYLEYFKETFDNLGLMEYDRSEDSRGGWIRFKNKAFHLQLLDDMGLVETNISPLSDQEQFRGIESYNSLLTLKKSSPTINESEKRKILGTRL